MLSPLRQDNVSNCCRLLQSISNLKKAHTLLKSLIAEETDTGRFYYQVQDYLNIPVMVKKETESVSRCRQGLWKTLIVSKGCD